MGSLIVPLGQSVDEPLAVTYVDRDGTRDVFRQRSRPGGEPRFLGLGGLVLGLASLPFTVNSTQQNPLSLCADTTYSPPPGVDMYMWRFVQVNGSGSYEVREFPHESRAIDIGDYWADDSLFRSTCGWESRVSLPDGLGRTLDYYRGRLEAYA